MSRKSQKDKIAERFKHIQTDRKYEREVLKFDARREMEALPKEE